MEVSISFACYTIYRSACSATARRVGSPDKYSQTSDKLFEPMATEIVAHELYNPASLLGRTVRFVLFHIKLCAASYGINLNPCLRALASMYSGSAFERMIPDIVMEKVQTLVHKCYTHSSISCLLNYVQIPESKIDRFLKLV